ncbi:MULTISPECIES: glycosyltransferase family 4 protein [unclassified Pseudomonas]|uniref:glycosyltransferase family 4 protein n=1 Tax=unclassified Pseudomonas TaxID=196821 RepID=UPI001CBDC1BE|nr:MULTISPECIES: glycosyltransferase family 4 protein [unclassified Pseudomonas]
MKIGFLSVFNYGSSIGGVENHIYFISQELSALGHDVIIFQPYENLTTNEPSISKDDNVTIVKIPIKPNSLANFLNRYNGAGSLGFLTGFLNKAKYLLHYRQVANIIESYNCDLIHQHDFISNVLTTKRLSKRGTPCILTNHTGEYLFFKKSFFGRVILKLILLHYRAVIGPSKELTPSEHHNSTTIYNGADLSLFKSSSEDQKKSIRTALQLKEEDFIVLCPRRWAPTKGVLYLIESIVSKNYDKKIQFLFAGSDYDGYEKYRTKLMSILENSNQQANVKLLGNLSIPKMVEAYSIADVVIIPSLMEAVSLSAIEAMACGAVVISTNVGGMPELIKHQENGLLIPPKSPEEIHEKITLLFQNREMLHNIQNNGFSTVVDFTWKSIASKTDAIYIETVQP